MEDMFSRFIVSEEDIARQQVEEDLQLYGSRPRPPDAVDNGESIQLENRILKRNASVFEATVDRPAKLSKSEHSITLDDGAVTAMDWNSGASPLDAWLNQSAIPSTATVLEITDQRESVDDLVAQESEEIKVFRNVHLATASSPEEKETVVDGVEGLELAAQIYYRNIRDRYPLLPTYLARRLAQANYQRSERFRSVVAQSPVAFDAPAPLSPLCQECLMVRVDFNGDGKYLCWLCISRRDFQKGSECSDLPDKSRRRREPRGDYTLGPDGNGSGQKLNSPSPSPESPSSDFWTGRAPRESPVSSINSSLHGRPTFDPEEQNPTFLTDYRRDLPASVSTSASLFMLPTLPPPPVELGKVLAFDCDICGRKIQVARRLEWQRHVLNDLRPYICTFPDCAMANESFTSRAGFLGHEMVTHGLGGIFRFVAPELKSYVSPLENNYHRDGIACLFCGKLLSGSGGDEYARHVGRHMEEIAFAVVTKPYEDWEFYSDCSGKSNKDLDEH